MPSYILNIVVQGSDQGATSTLRNVTGALSGLEGVGRGIMSVFGGNVLARAFFQITDGLKDMLGTAIEAAGNFQMLRIQLDGLLAAQGYLSGQFESVGAAEAWATQEGGKFTDWIADFAVKTQYTVLSLQTMSRGFLGMNWGIDQTKDMIGALAQLGAGLGISETHLGRITYNMQQTTRASKITAADLREYANAGIPLVFMLDAVAKKYGMSRKEAEKFVKSGAAGVEAWNQAILDVATTMFPNSLDKIQKTWQVAMSNIRDVVESILGKEVLGPAMEQVASVVSDGINLVLEHREDFRAFGEQIAVTVNQMIEGIKGFIPVVVGIGIQLGNVFTMLQTGDFKGGIFGLMEDDPVILFLFNLRDAGMAVAKFFTDHGPAIMGALTGIGAALAGLFVGSTILGVLTVIGGALAALASPVGILLTLAGLLGAAWVENWWGMRDTLTEFWVNTGEPALNSLRDWLDVQLPIAIQNLNNYWTQTLLPMLQSFGTWFMSEGLPALTNLWYWLLVNLPIAVQQLTLAWNTFMPTMIQLWTWFQINLPTAIQAFSLFWNMYLLPSFQFLQQAINGTNPTINAFVTFFTITIPTAVTGFLTFWNTNLIPIFLKVSSIMSTFVFPPLAALQSLFYVSLPDSLKTVSGAWDAFWKVLQFIWLWNTQYLFPYLMSIANFIGAVFSKIIEAFAGLWMKVLYPAIATVRDYLVGALSIAFQKVQTFLDGPLGYSVKILVGLLQDHLMRVFNLLMLSLGGIADALKKAADFFNNLADAVRNFQLPDWLTPGSPTPFEIGLWGIRDALRAVATEGFPAFDRSLMNSNFAGYENPAAPGLVTAPNVGLAGTAGVGSLIHIDRVEIRSEDDIEKLAYKLLELIQSRVR